MAKKSSFKELSKEQQQCLTLIESLGIYELRALSRVFGDNSPTTLKREQHINYVMDKIIAGEELKPIPTRQGRPYKELSNIEGILSELSVLAGKDYSLKNARQLAPTTHMQKNVTFRQMEEDVFQQKLFPILAKGVLVNKNDNEFFFVNLLNGGTVLVKKSLDKRLQEFDFVSGTAVMMNSHKDYIMDKIKAINYQAAASYSSQEQPYVAAAPSQSLPLGRAQVMLGSRNVVECRKFTELPSLKNVLKKLNDEKVITLALMPNVMPEEWENVDKLGFNTTFAIKYDERPLEAYNTITTFIDCVTRLQQLGLNVALFVEDVATLASLVDYAFKNNTKANLGHTEPAVDTMKKIMLLAKASKTGTSTTVFTTLDSADMFDQMYVSAIYKVSKKVNL